MTIKLYRAILRIHRRLPPAMRTVGDDYVKADFRRHQNCDPRYVPGFLNEWNQYRLFLDKQTANDKPTFRTTSPRPSLYNKGTDDGADILPHEKLYGRPLDRSRLEKFNVEQIGQLYALKQEILEPIASSHTQTDGDSPEQPLAQKLAGLPREFQERGGDLIKSLKMRLVGRQSMSIVLRLIFAAAIYSFCLAYYFHIFQKLDTDPAKTMRSDGAETPRDIEKSRYRQSVVNDSQEPLVGQSFQEIAPERLVETGADLDRDDELEQSTEQSAELVPDDETEQSESTEAEDGDVSSSLEVPNDEERIDPQDEATSEELHDNPLEPMQYVPVDFHPTSPEPLPCPLNVEPAIYLLAAHLDIRPLILTEARRPTVNIISITQNNPKDPSGKPMKYQKIWWHKPGLVSCAYGILDAAEPTGVSRIRVSGMSIATAQVRFFPKYQYSKLIFTCPVPDSNMLMVNSREGRQKFRDGVYFITIVPTAAPGDEQFISRWIPIQSRQKFFDFRLPQVETDSTGDDAPTAVCVKELRGGLYSPSMRVWLEYYRMHNFTHFFMTIVPPVDSKTLAVIKQYRDIGVLEYKLLLEPHAPGWDGCGGCVVTKSTMKAWSSMPALMEARSVYLNRESDLHNKHLLSYTIIRKKRFYGNQEALNQDCMMKSVGIYRWVAMIDFDEYLDHAAGITDDKEAIPMRARFNELAKSSIGPPKAIGFLNTFYCVHCNPDLNSLAAGIVPTMSRVLSKPGSRAEDVANGKLIPFKWPNCKIGGLNNVHQTCRWSEAPLESIEVLDRLAEKPGCLFNFNSKTMLQISFLGSKTVLPYIFYGAVRQNGFYRPNVRSKYVVDPLIARDAEVHTVGASTFGYLTTCELIEYDSTSIRNWISTTYSRLEIEKFDRWALQNRDKTSTNIWLDPKEGYMHHMRTPISMLRVFKTAASDYQRGVNKKVYDSQLRKKMEQCQKCEKGSMVMDYGFANRYGRPLLEKLLETCRT